jgi:hypothetical protein
MSGRELRVLRLLSRGPLYEGAFEIMLPDDSKKVRQAARSLVRQGYADACPMSEGAAPTYFLTAAGRSLAEAMTP